MRAVTNRVKLTSTLVDEFAIQASPFVLVAMCALAL